MINSMDQINLIRGSICIKPKIKANAPNNILVVGLVKGIRSKSSCTFLPCLIPKIIKTVPQNIINRPISQEKITSMLRLFVLISFNLAYFFYSSLLTYLRNIFSKMTIKMYFHIL